MTANKYATLKYIFNGQKWRLNMIFLFDSFGKRNKEIVEAFYQQNSWLKMTQSFSIIITIKNFATIIESFKLSCYVQGFYVNHKIRYVPLQK